MRNALHLAVNNSTDQADQALDLEMVLLRNDVGIFAKDVRGRLPLHYAFVKIKNHRNTCRTDPIEVPKKNVLFCYRKVFFKKK